MKLTDFKKGEKFVRPNDGFGPGEYLTFSERGYFVDQDGDSQYIKIQEIHAGNWEYYKEPKEERKPETWYLYEYKIKGKPPVVSYVWYKCIIEFVEFIENTIGNIKAIDFDIEPRVYEEREF